MLHYGKSSGIISDNKLIHSSLCYKYYITVAVVCIALNY